MPYESCSLDACGRPSDAVVVVVTVSLVRTNGQPVVQRALCGPHASWFAGVIRRLGGEVVGP